MINSTSLFNTAGIFSNISQDFLVVTLLCVTFLLVSKKLKSSKCNIMGSTFFLRFANTINRLENGVCEEQPTIEQKNNDES